jgi:hypothetical protein
LKFLKNFLYKLIEKNYRTVMVVDETNARKQKDSDMGRKKDLMGR